MSLKFTFSSPQPSHSHDDRAGGETPGIPLPFAGAPSGSAAASSSVLELRAALSGHEMVCEGVSGDGVVYARAVVSTDGRALAHALRSALARAGAALPEPLLGSVTGVVLALEGREAEALEGCGLTVSSGGVQLAAVDEALQARTGINAGTPIVSAAS